MAPGWGSRLGEPLGFSRPASMPEPFREVILETLQQGLNVRRI